MNRALLQVQLCYESMGRAERLAADYLLSHTEDVLALSITELASRCGTSEATLVRLSRRLGYGGYQELKLALAQDAEHRTVTPNIEDSDSCYAIFEKVCNDAYLSLERTKRMISGEALERAANLLASAGRIVSRLIIHLQFPPLRDMLPILPGMNIYRDRYRWCEEALREVRRQ